MPKSYSSGKRTVHVWSMSDIIATCPICMEYAIVPLTDALCQAQTDGTTHVCHPGFGGCNQGFALDPAVRRAA